MTPQICPFCGVALPDTGYIRHNERLAFNGYRDPAQPYLSVDIFKCPDKECGKETIFVYGVNGYIENKMVMVYPESGAIHFPDYIPQAIRTDYEEACSILNKSPKASATLSRRCLQGMIRDFWKIKKSRLVDEIEELRGKVPAAQWTAIDALRQMGNIGAHMEKDVNIIVDIDENEADMLLQLIELLIRKWYINRHDEEELYKKIIESNLDKKKPS